MGEERGKKGAKAVEEKTGAAEARRTKRGRFLAASPYLPRVLPR